MLNEVDFFGMRQGGPDNMWVNYLTEQNVIFRFFKDGLQLDNTELVHDSITLKDSAGTDHWTDFLAADSVSYDATAKKLHINSDTLSEGETYTVEVNEHYGADSTKLVTAHILFSTVSTTTLTVTLSNGTPTASDAINIKYEA
jgi:hypothetical protein